MTCMADHAAVMSLGSNNASSHSLPPPLQMASRDANTDSPIQKDQKSTQQQDNFSDKDLKQQHGSITDNLQQHNSAPQESNHFPFPPKQSQGDRQQGQIERNPIQIPQTAGTQITGKTPDSESQYLKLQKMSNQQATVSEQPSNPTNRGKQVPFGMLLPVLLPQLDKDKGMQLQILFGKLKVGSRKDFFIDCYLFYRY